MRQKRTGDTLIEVLIAFAILSAVMATAFSAAISGYKSSQVARDRTIGAFLSQYQAEALRAYRNALAWSPTATGAPSFLEGYNLENSSLTAMNEAKTFCMKKNTAGQNDYWDVETDPTICNKDAKDLAPQLKDPKMLITKKDSSPAPPSSPEQIAYEVVFSWVPANSTNSALREESKTRVILTKR